MHIFSSRYIFISESKGQSLMEVVIAMAIFSLIASSLVSLILGSLSLTNEGGLITQADMLAQEGAEAVVAIKNRAWNELLYSESAIENNGTNWQFAGEGTSEQVGRFSRVIQFFPVFRDNNGQICAEDVLGANLDLESLAAKIIVSWQSARNTTNQVEKNLLLTNWDANIWTQSDWSGGGGQELFGEANKYYSDDGNIDSTIGGFLALKSVATSTYATEGFLVSSAFFIGANGAPSLVFADWNKPIDCELCMVSLQIMSAPDNGGAPGLWTDEWSGFEGLDGDESDYYNAATSGSLIHTDLNEGRWFRYKLILNGTETETPLVEEIRLDYKR